LKVEIELKHKKQLEDIQSESHDEQDSTTIRQSQERIQKTLQRKEKEFEQQLTQQGQLTAEDSDRIIKEHQKEMEAIKENLIAEQQQQKKVSFITKSFYSMNN